ncbi:hypothetical protein [Alteromonas sp. C1M14]|uniref:hypothetical protein n=1 Tax=Alteromonas sp. C1M14 TaxID=2841567 RepID=UPI001C080886|nr:hypothetical protein [Alteromonas sp. C1M14]MBU2979318.1 hypothetical protein [Alteromonas sp. C1M14]
MKIVFNGDKVWRVPLMATAMLAITACGSSDSESEANLLEGVFLDSAVEGLAYKTDTLSGVTDEKGTFYYHEGESITFSIGGIELGEVPGGEVISPYSFATSDAVSPDVVTNIAQFLQTLDIDGDPTNGILISDAMLVAAEDLALIFDVSSDEFAADSDLTTALELLATHLEYSYEHMVSVEAALAHLDETLGTDDDTGTGGDDDTGTGGDDDSGTGGDDDTGTGGDDDTGTGGDDDTGTGGDDIVALTSLSVTGNDGTLSSIWDYLAIRDIAVGYTEFTGVDESVLLVGGEDVDSVETLSGLTSSPNNGFAMVAAFADGTNITGASIISVVAGTEYNFECTVNCDIAIDIESQLITFDNAEFIWEDDNESIFVSGSVPWVDGDEYVDTTGWVGSEAPTDTTFCATNLATTATALSDGGLAYTTDDGNCVGLLSVESHKFTKPLTATIVATGDGAASGSLSIDSQVKIYSRTVDKGIDYTDESGNPLFESIVQGAFTITNTSAYELCLSDIDDWQMLKADGSELVKSEMVTYSFSDTSYSYNFTSFNDFSLPGLSCLPPSGTTIAHLTLLQYVVSDSDELLLPEVAEIAVSLEAEYNLVSEGTLYTTLTPNYMEWLYVNGTPGIRFAFTNNTGIQLVQDDTHPVWYYDNDGYPILRSYVYLHKELGVEDYELINSDLIINDGDQVVLLDDSAEIAILALGGGNAVKAVLYPDF